MLVKLTPGLTLVVGNDVFHVTTSDRRHKERKIDVGLNANSDRRIRFEMSDVLGVDLSVLRHVANLIIIHHSSN